MTGPLIPAVAALAGLMAGGGIASFLDLVYRSGRAGPMNRAPAQRRDARRSGGSREPAPGPDAPGSGSYTSSAAPSPWPSPPGEGTATLGWSGILSGSAGVSPAPAPDAYARSMGETLVPGAWEGTGPSPTSVLSSSARRVLSTHTRRIILLAVATAAVWAIAAMRAVDLRHFLLMALFSAVLLALTVTDFERHLLPNRLLYPALAVALLLSAAWPGRTPFSGLIGGAVGLAVMFGIFLLLPGFGFGDVKLAGLIGLLLGIPGVLTGLLAGAILGGAGAAVLLATRRARLGTAIAYGPYLAGGAILEMLLRR